VTQLIGQRILVIEDDPIISLDIECTLAAAGAEIVGPGTTVSRALELSNSPGLTGAIVDLRLQRESAGPVIDNLRRRGIPFIFYSGHADQQEAARIWPDAPLLMKPARHEAIVGALAASIAKRSSP
jgi:DNA-binding NtrC family response regulator